ncbi:hypothetical protein [Spirosoma endophyticum]|uniref:Uncharacterized protein n=1 Tax=Spirosoma endophyticum TaxID=662367 RepID=A0A1I1URI0_9BACT|nr:hypothetical protein [Spirosoma endophyticum]SFD72268.1 hypothetical protein SAMN05216167_106335 [Spirosoma endophyticum]
MKDRNKLGRFVAGHKVNAYSQEQLDTFFEDYCIHLTKGLNQESFGACDYRTMKKYASTSMMQTEKIRVARASGMHFYETVLIACITGLKNKDTINEEELEINPRNIRPETLIFVMKNKYPEIYGNRRRQKNIDNLKIDVYSSTLIVVVKPDDMAENILS